MNLKAYALQVTVVAIIAMVAEALAPEGKTKKTVRTVFSLICTLAFVLPVLSVFKGGIDFATTEKQDTFAVDESFFTFADETREEYLTNKVSRALIKEGIDGAKINIDYIYSDGITVVNFIEINLSKSVINGVNGHINITEVATKACASALNIERGKVIIIE